MKQNPEILSTLAAFRDATWELDNVYTLFPKSCGLSEAEYWSLLLIYEGVATQSQISERLFVSRQTLNSAFKQLRKKGLIYLEPYEENLRSKQSSLTEKGKRFVDEHIMRMHRIEENAWKKLSSDEHDTLISLTKKISCLIQSEMEQSKSNTV